MFAFYTVSYVAILWLEVSAAVLFIDEYGANSLPLIYLAGAGMGAVLGFFYSWLQRFLSLRRVIVLTPVLMALPLMMFKLGLSPAFLGGYSVFLIRLWLDALYTLNELNTSITANQIFNIREIKRSYPFISSGVLIADVISGLSLPILRKWIGLENIVFLASFALLIGAMLMLVLVSRYRQAFPDSTRRKTQDTQPTFAARRLKGPLRLYVGLVIVFFAMCQALWFHIDFQYLSQLEQNFDVSGGEIADFLALLSALLGIAELATQWFAASRVIERLGVFVATMLLPLAILGVSSITMVGLVSMLWGVVVLRFVDEWLRYTVLAGTAPVLFQPIPEYARGQVQEWVRGIAEPVATGLSGILIIGTIWFCQRNLKGFGPLSQDAQNWVFVAEIGVLATIGLLAAIALRSRYMDLLVLSAERGQLNLASSEADSRAFRRAIVEAIDSSKTVADQKQCIQLLAGIAPANVCELLAPRLQRTVPEIQQQILEVMLNNPDESYLDDVRSLLNHQTDPIVFALAMRYVWLLESHSNLEELRQYLKPDVDAVIRGAAAALMLRQGNSQEKSEATNVLRRMLTNDSQERERLMGCRALEDAKYLQALSLYIPGLLRDRSLRVRCAALEAIAATQFEDYYSAIVRALYFSSTREAAINALTRLGVEVVPMLIRMAEESHRPHVVRAAIWKAISRIGTDDALASLVKHLMSSWGNDRRSLLRTLLSANDEDGIEATAEILGRRGIENLINQELSFIGHTYAALIDLVPAQKVTQELGLLRRALHYQRDDAIDRLFLLMRFLYPSDAIQAAAFNIGSDSDDSNARGLEILDNTIDLQKKQIVLMLLEPHASDKEKLNLLKPMIGYEPMSPSQRLRFLLELRAFLSDWTLACCFHFARRSHWSVTIDQILYGLRHEASFVREASLMYLQMASPRGLAEVLPTLANDPDPTIAAQVQQLLANTSSNQIRTDSEGRSPLLPSV
ncbi:MAG: HEAT repeat domain-containing protein [Leptolyngbyaceae bacterium]|nr:HEAT repeat domain-containing protein [Leptolyngbyaceae bacterium]